MAATNISGAERLPEADYSVPHRNPPPVPSQPTSPRFSPSPPLQQQQTASSSNLRGRAQEDSVSVSTSEHRRRGSFGVGSFLRRTPSSGSKAAAAAAAVGEREEVPPLPTTRIAQAHFEAQGRSSTSSNRKASGEGRSMFRAGSKAQRQREQQAREAERQAYLNRPPPQLNAPDVGPSSFGDDGDPRPDSVAIFNNQYHNTSSAPASRAANNFSRPGGAMPASSSPAYAVRGGSAYSSPNMTGKVNGSKEYVGSMDRTESMTNRGRYSYASSMAPVNVSSPRRVRRRKDPTPFK